jgi:cytoplasmic iron level regulating protein YaaA (DUF328/UPF0246 family)
MKILIPPSEGKNTGGDCRALGNLSNRIKDKLKLIPIDENKLAKFYGVKGLNLEKAMKSNATLKSSPTMTAIERYTGVVYKGISYETLSDKGKKYFNENILIVSGLFDLVKPQDLIPNYKFKMQNGNELIIDDFCIDLLPKLHQSAVKYSEGFVVDFVIEKEGKRMPAGHSGKLIKGKFIRWLCENQIKDQSRFKEFNEDEFKFDGHNFIKN